jgi:hypothetical protein
MMKAGTIWFALILATAMSGSVATQDQSGACRFTSTPPSGAPAIVAPDEVKSRLQLIAQPDSPVDIVSADFTGTRLMVEPGQMFTNYSFQPKTVFEVRNRSDQAIARVDIGVRAGGCDDTMIRPAQFMRALRLLPGETGRIEPVNMRLDVRGALNGLPLKVWTWIDRVDFGTCIYQPVQKFPEDVCASESRTRSRR